MSLWTRESKWTLRSEDDPTKVITGQFRPSNMVENVSGDWATQSSLGLPQPVIQFAGGMLETISFDAKVWAFNSGGFNPLTPLSMALQAARNAINGGSRDGGLNDINPYNADVIKDAVDFIRNMPRPDPALGRPHVWLLSWTDEFQARVVVQSVGGIRYDHGRQPGTGPATQGKFTLRGVLFSFTCARYEVRSTDDLIKPAESYIYRVKEGDTYESVAKSLWADARLGDVLRKRNPDKPSLSVGQRIHIPSRVTARREYDPAMTSLTFKAGASQDELAARHFALRSGSYRSLRIRGSVF